MNADLAVCGFCVVFGEPSEDGRPADLREDYDPFTSFGGQLPVWVDHMPMLSSSGLYDAGRVSHFAIVNGPAPIPHGLLCLLELADNDIGRSVLGAVARGQLWAFSLGGNGRPEVSLTGRPAYTSCRVVGWGEDAVSRWELLTGVPADRRVSTGSPD